MSGPDCPRCIFGEIEDGECTDCGFDADDLDESLHGDGESSLDEFDECPVCHETLGVNEDGEAVCLWCTEGIA